MVDQNDSVIIISDSDDDDLQVVRETHSNTAQPNRIQQQQQQPLRNNNNDNNNDNDDDDLQITDVVEVQPQRPRVLLHTPTGEIEIPALNPTRPQETRSFENQRPIVNNPVRIEVPRTREERQVRLTRQQVAQNVRQRNNRPTRAEQLLNVYREGVEQRRTNAREAGREAQRAIRQWQEREQERQEQAFLRTANYGRGYTPYDDDGEYDEEDDDDYLPGNDHLLFDYDNYLGPVRMGHNMPFQFRIMFNPNGNGNGNGNDDIPAHIYREIEQREMQAWNESQKLNLSETTGQASKLKEMARSVKSPYTVTIDPSEDYVCVLCGVTLGVGIEDDFKRSDCPLEQLQEKYDVQAPYQASNLTTETDKDLSKRVFLGRCGHTYCGRCVKNITSIKGILKKQKVKKYEKNEKNINNPLIYAPLKCIGTNCNKNFNVKNPFNEVFL